MTVFRGDITDVSARTKSPVVTQFCVQLTEYKLPCLVVYFFSLILNLIEFTSLISKLIFSGSICVMFARSVAVLADVSVQ